MYPDELTVHARVVVAVTIVAGYTVTLSRLRRGRVPAGDSGIDSIGGQA